MNVKKHEADEPTNDDGIEVVAIIEDNAMVPTNGITSMVENDSPSSFCVAKEVLTFFEYGGVIGYKAFLAWAMDVGNYIQGDLAVWHWADVCRLVENYEYDLTVHFIIQNDEYAIIIAENTRNQLVKLFKVRIKDLEPMLNEKPQSASRVGNSL